MKLFPPQEVSSNLSAKSFSSTTTSPATPDMYLLPSPSKGDTPGIYGFSRESLGHKSFEDEPNVEIVDSAAGLSSSPGHDATPINGHRATLRRLPMVDEESIPPSSAESSCSQLSTISSGPAGPVGPVGPVGGPAAAVATSVVTQVIEAILFDAEEKAVGESKAKDLDSLSDESGYADSSNLDLERLVTKPSNDEDGEKGGEGGENEGKEKEEVEAEKKEEKGEEEKEKAEGEVPQEEEEEEEEDKEDEGKGAVAEEVKEEGKGNEIVAEDNLSAIGRAVLGLAAAEDEPDVMKEVLIENLYEVQCYHSAFRAMYLAKTCSLKRGEDNHDLRWERSLGTGKYGTVTLVWHELGPFAVKELTEVSVSLSLTCCMLCRLSLREGWKGKVGGGEKESGEEGRERERTRERGRGGAEGRGGAYIF